ncbi:MAG: sigma-70 family RNA polymerase sigma factor [Oscillospiraceae bacterium]|nr:sigma-70 family RNA polymerase sigma factor [Oscillospiraceae bacterium]
MTVEKIIAEYSEMLYRIAFSRTGNSHDAEDIVQNVFLKALQVQNDNKAFENSEHIKAWLIRLTINESSSLTRKAYKQHEFASDLTDDFAFYNTANASSDKELHRIETRMTVYPAVASLPEKERVIIHLFYYEDLQISEICEVTKLGSNTVKSLLHRARKRLKEKLKGVDFYGEKLEF